jgi:hypothetical protein
MAPNGEYGNIHNFTLHLLYLNGNNRSELMYGLINRAIKDLVVDQRGEAAWKQVCVDAEVFVDDFIAMDSYPDATTYALIGSASRLLDLPQDAILREFGRKWITYTADRGYGELLDGWGTDVGTFLDNLNQMHARLRLAMPKLEPPYFEVVERNENSLTLRYYSERPGLAPMVLGLLEGVGERFQMPVQTELRPRHSQEQDYEEFFVAWQSGAPSAN